MILDDEIFEEEKVDAPNMVEAEPKSVNLGCDNSTNLGDAATLSTLKPILKVLPPFLQRLKKK